MMNLVTNSTLGSASTAVSTLVFNPKMWDTKIVSPFSGSAASSFPSKVVSVGTAITSGAQANSSTSGLAAQLVNSTATVGFAAAETCSAADRISHLANSTLSSLPVCSIPAYPSLNAMASSTPALAAQLVNSTANATIAAAAETCGAADVISNLANSTLSSLPVYSIPAYPSLNATASLSSRAVDYVSSITSYLVNSVDKSYMTVFAVGALLGISAFGAKALYNKYYNKTEKEEVVQAEPEATAQPPQEETAAATAAEEPVVEQLKVVVDTTPAAAATEIQNLSDVSYLGKMRAFAKHGISSISSLAKAFFGMLKALFNRDGASFKASIFSMGTHLKGIVVGTVGTLIPPVGRFLSNGFSRQILV